MSEHSTMSHQSPIKVAAVANEVIPAQESLKQEIWGEELQHVHLQCKLSIGSTDDPLELEADAIADTVVRMPEQNFIQRKCNECEEEDKLQRKPLISFIQRKESSAGAVASDTVTNQINSSRGSGSSMDGHTLSFMQSRFGTDFSYVKIHTGHESVQMNRELNAKAFTVGNDIYFNEGQYNPNSNEGKHLLAHELTHTVQQSKGVSRKIQRFAPACRGLLNNPVGALGRVLTGTAIHLAIQADFMRSVSGGLSGFGIPGASAAALRTSGLCGEDMASIAPQIIGGRAGMGFPDLSCRVGPAMQIAEIKPASWNCVVDGVAQLGGYLTQGNATDAPQVAWRTGQGIAAIVPMLPSMYPGRTLVIGSYTVQIEWCSPGLMVYQVIGSSTPLPVPVPVPSEAPEPARIRQRSGWDRVRDFAEEAIRTGATSGAAIRAFLENNQDLIDLIIGIGVVGLIATFAEDIATFGAGILDDLVTVPFFAAMIRIAMQMRPA